MTMSDQISLCNPKDEVISGKTFLKFIVFHKKLKIKARAELGQAQPQLGLRQKLEEEKELKFIFLINLSLKKFKS